MAKIDLKFLSKDDDQWNISTISDIEDIFISIDTPDDTVTICLDKSTAIKFAKTLRTEINKITESEAING